jgi:hypothetical protein
VSEIWSVRERRNEHQDFFEAKNGLLGSVVLLGAAFAAPPTPPPKPSPIEGEGSGERGMLWEMRDTALAVLAVSAAKYQRNR